MNRSQELAYCYSRMASAEKYPGAGQTADDVKASSWYVSLKARALELERELDAWRTEHAKHCKGCHACAR